MKFLKFLGRCYVVLVFLFILPCLGGYTGDNFKGLILGALGLILSAVLVGALTGMFKNNY